jgi:hypothetical protein
VTRDDLLKAIEEAAIDEVKKDFSFLKNNIDIDEADVEGKFTKSLDDILRALEIARHAIGRKFPNG